MRKITLAATQFAVHKTVRDNIEHADRLVREAAKQGAQVVLLQELFEGEYFCQEENPAHFARATTVADNPAVKHFSALARELKLVIPVSFFERAGQAYFNSLAVIDADGSNLGIYRKSHIPDGPGYEEKFYFSPGDTGVKVWDTAYGRIGIGVCWDQWFPELARAMVLQGAECILYPTAIGSEPRDASVDSMPHWQTVMRGHAAANLVPVVASNRIGREEFGSSFINFYGSSFICGPHGDLVQTASRDGESVLVHSFDLDEIRQTRAAWGLFRDRRPDLYGSLLSLDGSGRGARSE